MLFFAFDSDNVTEGMLARLAAARSSRAVPDRLPAPRPRPTVLDAVEAWRSAGLHGRKWSGVSDPAVAERLPPCPDPATCRPEDGVDLGRWHLVGGGTRR